MRSMDRFGKQQEGCDRKADRPGYNDGHRAVRAQVRLETIFIGHNNYSNSHLLSASM